MTLSIPAGSLTKTFSTGLSSPLGSLTAAEIPLSWFLDGSYGSLPGCPFRFGNIYTDTGGTTPATQPGDLIALATDLSPNGVDWEQATSGSRYRLGVIPTTGIRNLLASVNTPSEAFEDWQLLAGGTASTPVVTSGFTDPLGGNTARRIQIAMGGGTTAGDLAFVRSLGFIAAGSRYNRVWIKNNGGASTAVFLQAAGATAAFLRTFTDSWTEIEFATSGNTAMDIGARGHLNPLDLDILVAFAQPEVAASPTAYQKVTNAYTITQSGIPSQPIWYQGGGNSIACTLDAGTYTFAIAGDLGCAFIPGIVHGGGTVTLGTSFMYNGGSVANVSTFAGTRLLGCLAINRALTAVEEAQLLAAVVAVGCPGETTP